MRTTIMTRCRLTWVFCSTLVKNLLSLRMNKLARLRV